MSYKDNYYRQNRVSQIVTEILKFNAYKKITKHSKGLGSILDVGCGNGIFRINIELDVF